MGCNAPKKTFRTARRIAASALRQCAGPPSPRAAFINDADDAERSRDSLDQQPIRRSNFARMRPTGSGARRCHRGPWPWLRRGHYRAPAGREGAGVPFALAAAMSAHWRRECLLHTHASCRGFVNRKVFLLRRSKRQRMRAARAARRVRHDGRGTGSTGLRFPIRIRLHAAIRSRARTISSGG